MSAKIYNAFRVKDPSSVWSLLWQIEDTARKNIARVLRAHYLELVESMDADDAEYQAEWRREQEPVPGIPHYPHTEQRFRLDRAHNFICDSYRKNCTSHRRDRYSLDVTVGIYPHEGAFYLRTFAEPISVLGDVLDFVSELPELEDFHFQNSTDRPDSVSEADWDRREEIWNAILKAHEDVGRHVGLDICCWHAFYRIDPWFQLAREWLDAPPDLPIREEVWARKLRKLKKLSDVVARPGRIEARAGETRVCVAQAAGAWVSTIGDVTAEHPSLNHAASYVEFEHLPDLMKEMVLRMIERATPAQ